MKRSWAALCTALLAAAPPGMHHIRAGDAAWAAGQRVEARAEWTAAAQTAHPATRAMAEARLLRVSGNLGMLVHGPRRDTALARCPAEVDWCVLARADAAALGRSMGLPADVDGAKAALDAMPSDALSDERAQRRLWLEEGPPSSPGTWVLGLSPIGASGLGFGAAVLFRHPDLALRGHQLSLQAGGTGGGNWMAGGSLDTWTAVGLHAEAAAQSTELQLYGVDGVPRPTAWTALSLTAAPQLGDPRRGGWVGPALWRDQAAGHSWTSPGLRGAVWHTSSRGLRLRAEAQAMPGQHRLLSGELDLRSAAVRRGPVFRAVASPSLSDPSTPTWRLPGWGGGQVLRQGAWSQFRSPWLAGAVAEWRQPLAGPLAAVAFTEGAWAERPVIGGGGGIRLALPPDPSSAVRLDVGHGTGGLGISAGWGSAF